MTTDFVPLSRMLERTAIARGESDVDYFHDQMYLGELTIKIMAAEALALLKDDREGHLYALEHKAVRADGIGGWHEVLESAVTGPASQHLAAEGRDSQSAITAVFPAGDPSWQRQAIDLLNRACRNADRGFEDITQQKVSLLKWVSQFAWLRNRTRGHGAPRGAKLSKVCLPLSESIMLVVENMPTFRRSWAYIHPNLSGRYRVSRFGGDREDFAYLTKETGHVLPEGVYIFCGSPLPVALLFTDSDLTDFFLPNGQFRNKSFQVQSQITDERRTESGAAFLVHPGALPSSETRALPDLEIVGGVLTNMPPRPAGYVSRVELEAELERLMLDERNPVITLQGGGGVGKTSLAIEILHRIAGYGKYYTIIWFSARDIDLLEIGPRVVAPDVLSIEDIAVNFFQTMQPGTNPKRGDAIRYLRDCLSGFGPDGPYIFVVDNFETIRGQEELYSSLNAAVRLPNKVLITTRARDFRGDYPVDVRGMTNEQFDALVTETAKRLEIDQLLNTEFRNKLYAESGGHPYIGKVLLSEAANDAKAGKAIQIKRVGAAGQDAMLDALFDRSYSNLKPVPKRVFLTLCGWGSLIPRIGLLAVLLRPANDRIDVDNAITELAQNSLIEVVREQQANHEYLSVPLAAAAFGKKKLVTSQYKTAVDADLELLQGFGATTSADLNRGLDRRVELLGRRAARRAATEGADITQEIAIIRFVASEYPRAWLVLADLMQENYGDLTETDAVSKYVEECPEDQKAWERLIRLLRRTGDYVAEMNARLQLAELAQPAFTELSSAASRLTGLLNRKQIVLDADERRLMVHKLRTLIEARYDEADAADDFSKLAWLCIHDKDFPAAHKWAERGLRLEPNHRHCLKIIQRVKKDNKSVLT